MEGQFQPGMSLEEAAERIAPLVDVDPGCVAGFVMIVVVDHEEGPGIAASENITPAMAVVLLQTAGAMLAARLTMEHERRNN